MDTNEAVVRTYIEALDQGDEATVSKLTTEHVILHFPGRSRFAGDYFGKSAVLTFWRSHLRQMGDGPAVITIQDVSVTQEQVLALITLEAKRDGDAMLWRGYFVFHVRDQQVVEWWCQLDDLDTFDHFWSYRAAQV